MGNFPQAFSHVSLVNTAYNLTRYKGPSEERADRKALRRRSYAELRQRCGRASVATSGRLGKRPSTYAFGPKRTIRLRLANVRF